jgi:hypothetical protein
MIYGEALGKTLLLEHWLLAWAAPPHFEKPVRVRQSPQSLRLLWPRDQQTSFNRRVVFLRVTKGRSFIIGFNQA